MDLSRMMTKFDIARALEQIAFLLELRGENSFKVKAYSHAAEILQKLPQDPADLVRPENLGQVKGIGPTLSATILEIITTGHSRLHEELLGLFPAGLLELAGIPGLGPKKLKIIHEQLGVSSLGELQYACIENRLVDLPGFGLKGQERLLTGIRQFQRHKGFQLTSVAIAEAENLLDAVRSLRGIKQADLAGDLRRKSEVVQNLCMVIACSSIGPVATLLAGIAGMTQVTHKDRALITCNSPQGLPLEIFVAEPSDYGGALFRATGQSTHVQAVMNRIAAPGAFLTEEAIYDAAALPYIPPELREGHGEIELAETGQIPALVEASQIQGIFHTHTLYSDGAATVAEMAAAARDLGYRYIGISDHSQAAFYARGLKEDRILAQRAEIAAVQKALPEIRIFKGIEADILPDGTMDYSDELLGSFDFVIASVHSRFNLSEDDQTRRICRALSNPHVTMLGHATGRLLLSRDGYRADMKQVIDTAAQYDKLIEINASPHRLELDWRLCRYAKQRGVRFSINPDAHSTDALKTVPLGVNVARKGGLCSQDIINTLPADDMASYLDSRRPAAAL
jgi:DNA polymerase (family 10)